MSGSGTENASGHGGDLRRLGRMAGKDPGELLDFSVNVRPEGPPEFIVAALWRAMGNIAAYPSPHAEEAVEAATAYYGLNGGIGPGGEISAGIVFGNGSNELIHALMRVLRAEGRSTLTVAEPAFSEYALAGRAAGMDVRHARGTPPFPPDWERLLRDAPRDSAVILANPGNPSGVYAPCGECAAAFGQRPDLVWIVDEAFIEYVADAADGAHSLLPLIPRHPDWVVLRSLTKFHGLPGLRLGYAAAGMARARRLRAALPAWTVNAPALAAACAVFEDRSDFAATARRANRERRADLVARLNELPVQIFPSEANYVLFRWPGAPAGLVSRLLAEHGIVIRDCSNYHGLEDGTWFRVAVRFPADHERLVRAMRAVARPPAAAGRAGRRGRPGRPPALMIQGTSSNAGKSVLAAAFCRLLRRDGYDVAPFKAQNMSLNSGVTASGGEMGRAQIVQALACRVDPDVRMNPVLLKPHSDTGSQVILLGKAVGHMDARTYFRAKRGLWADVARAYDELAAGRDVMVLEGAGSPGEINLKDGDLVNMRMAEHAGASVLLVGDIDRGGVYASFLGTWMTFTPAERRLVAGFVVNRFRGDAALLGPAHEFLLRRTGRPVLGIVPYIRDLGLPEEDMAGCGWDAGAPPLPAAAGPERPLDVAVVMVRHMSNATDFAPLALEPDVRLRPVRRAEDWGEPDVVMLPGSKSVAADLAELRAGGLADRILAHAGPDPFHGGWLFGVCGGLQMLGRRLSDPEGVESDARETEGLGLLDLETEMGTRKTLRRVERAETPLGAPSGGYEIHHGRTRRGAAALPLFRRRSGTATEDSAGCGEESVCGYVTGRRWATYLHGIFDDDAFRRAFLDHVRADLGLLPQGRVRAVYDVERSLDRLADAVRAGVDMDGIYRSLGLR